jgi:hypothetical protein
MIAKCANPTCSHPFLCLREGKLYRFESKPKSRGAQRGGYKSSEYFWLCGTCASTMKLRYQDGSGVITEFLRPELPAAKLSAQLVA